MAAVAAISGSCGEPDPRMERRAPPREITMHLLTLRARCMAVLRVATGATHTRAIDVVAGPGNSNEAGSAPW